MAAGLTAWWRFAVVGRGGRRPAAAVAGGSQRRAAVQPGGTDSRRRQATAANRGWWSAATGGGGWPAGYQVVSQSSNLLHFVRVLQTMYIHENRLLGLHDESKHSSTKLFKDHSGVTYLYDPIFCGAV